MSEEHSKWGKLLIEGLEEALAYTRGEATDVRVHTVEVTARKAHLELPPYYPPHLIREIRHKLSVSQAIFGQMLGVSASSVRAWEQGKREPEGPTRRLLQIAERHPAVLKEACDEVFDAADVESAPPQTLHAPVQSPRRDRLAADTGFSRQRGS
ncbi:MAG TPA: type II toxin-antitoxin system MqsA family antitoxin [Longimicrobium sp.]|jgi:putative transcriptional regulator|uniref:helix-turn-helix domain-containing protein n=1 Tax=Longimicrobium sp. TaxID=2029185 RepID=UPI002ED83888